MDFQQARHLKGKMIRYRNKQDEWSIGRVSSVKKEGLLIEELRYRRSNDGYGYGFWGGGPFFGPPVFFPFAGFGFNSFFFL